MGDARTTAGAADPVMRNAFPSGMNGQIVVAMDKAGILQQSGLKAEFNSFQYGPPMMEALAAGPIDAGGTGLIAVDSSPTKVPGGPQLLPTLVHTTHSPIDDNTPRLTSP